MTELEVKQGATFRVVFAWEDADGVPVSLTGLSARMQARPSHRSDEVLLDLTEGAGLTLDHAAGEIRVEIPATTTAALSRTVAVFDVEVFDLADPDEVTRLVEGRLRVSPEVTR